MEGLALLLAHGELPSCEDCQRWVYDAKTWQPARARGQRLPRAKNMPLPCATCPKSDRHDPRPRPDRELSARNVLAIEYFHLCAADATGILPRDAIVVRNNSICVRVREMVRQQKQDALLQLALSVPVAR